MLNNTYLVASGSKGLGHNGGYIEDVKPGTTKEEWLM